MNLKPNQRVAYYEVTYSNVGGIDVGMVLVDRMRGKHADWHFFNEKTGDITYAGGTLLGYARVGTDRKVVPEPALQAVLDAKRAKLETVNA